MPSVKTEPVDPEDVIQQTIPVPLAAVLDKITAGPVPVIDPPVTTLQTSLLESTDAFSNRGQGIDSYSEIFGFKFWLNFFVNETVKI